ncbi:hypothetical protein BaRGS_00011157, partial [Batillaria attramentaria]
MAAGHTRRSACEQQPLQSPESRRNSSRSNSARPKTDRLTRNEAGSVPQTRPLQFKDALRFSEQSSPLITLRSWQYVSSQTFNSLSGPDDALEISEGFRSETYDVAKCL